MRPKERAEKLACNQHGVVTARQARSCEMTRDEIRQQVRSGRWIDIRRGTYLIVGTPRTWEQRTIACVLAEGDLAAASHLAAASLMGLVASRPELIDVTVPYAHDAHAAGCVLHRARNFGRPDIRTVNKIPVTCPARTLVDIAGVLDARRLGAALDRALLRGLVSIAALRRYIDDRGLRRRRGVGRLMKLLDDREFGVPESELERVFLALVEEYDLPAPARQQPVGPYQVDFAYADLRILIEVDGRATHGTAEAFEEDPVRQNALVLEGWTVIRFTWKQVTQQPGYVVATIRRALAGP